jgi:hypothetical protein
MGDTLSRLAEVAGVSIERILRRNCLPDGYQAVAGDALLLPLLAQITPPPSDAILDCTAPTIAAFTTVEAGQILRGLVEIRGVVGGADFRRYRLEIRPDGYLRYFPVLSGNTPVNGRVLGILDTSGLPTGVAWLRLVVITGAGTMLDGQVCAIPVIIAQ